MKYILFPEFLQHCTDLPSSCQWDVDGGSPYGIDAGSALVILARSVEIKKFQVLVHMPCIVLQADRFVVQERTNRTYCNPQVLLSSFLKKMVSSAGFLLTYNQQSATKT
jgi:hypothetical protein